MNGLSFEVQRGEIFGFLGPNGAGKTIVLTTHHMEEAELLSDRIAIIDHGEIQAIGTPAS